MCFVYTKHISDKLDLEVSENSNLLFLGIIFKQNEPR